MIYVFAVVSWLALYLPVRYALYKRGVNVPSVVTMVAALIYGLVFGALFTTQGGA